MHSIEQRRETILKITSAVLERQKDYFTGNILLTPDSVKYASYLNNSHRGNNFQSTDRLI